MRCFAGTYARAQIRSRQRVRGRDRWRNLNIPLSRFRGRNGRTRTAQGWRRVAGKITPFFPLTSSLVRHFFFQKGHGNFRQPEIFPGDSACRRVFYWLAARWERLIARESEVGLWRLAFDYGGRLQLGFWGFDFSGIVRGQVGEWRRWIRDGGGWVGVCWLSFMILCMRARLWNDLWRMGLVTTNVC